MNAPPPLIDQVALLDEVQLLTRRQELQTLGRSRDLTELELTEICAIYGRLRSRGTPKTKTPTATAAAVSRRAKKVNILDIPL
jgi:hypothetical protein